MGFCDCNGRRIPTKWKVTISGVTNAGCSDCSGIDGDYYPEQVGTSCTDFSVSVTGGACGLHSVEVDVADANGMMILTVTFKTTNDAMTYIVTEVRDPLAGTIRVPGFAVLKTDCLWPDEITLTAVGPAISELKSATCLAGPFPPVIPPYAGLDAIPGQIPAYQCPAEFRRTRRAESAQRQALRITCRSRGRHLPKETLALVLALPILLLPLALLLIQRLNASPLVGGLI